MEIKINIELKGEDREDFIYFEMKGCYWTIMSDKHYNLPEDKTRGKVALMIDAVSTAKGGDNWDWSEVEDLSDLTIGEFNVLN